MTIIGEVSRDMSKIIDRLAKYELAIEEAEPLFQIEGKKLEEVNRTLPGHLVRYDELYREMKNIEELLVAKREKVESDLWRKYNEKYSKALTTRDIQAYISGEPEYTSATELILEVRYLKEQLNAIVEAFKQMGWTLKNIVELRVNELQEAIL